MTFNFSFFKGSILERSVCMNISRVMIALPTKWLLLDKCSVFFPIILLSKIILFIRLFKKSWINQGIFCHVNLETDTGKFWLFAVSSDKFAKWTINMWCAVYSVQYVVRSVHVQIQGHLQVQVQCVMYTVQCARCTLQFQELVAIGFSN